MQGRVQQRGVDAKARCVFVKFIRELRLDIDCVFRFPDRTQTPVRWSVAQTTLGKGLIKPRQIDRLCLRRRPCGDGGMIEWPCGLRKHAASVLDPRCLERLAVGSTAKDKRSIPFGIWLSHPQLKLGRRLFRWGQR